MTEIGKWSGLLDRIIENLPEDGQTLGSGQLDRIIENHHIQTEDGQRLGNSQVDLTGSLRTITYILRMRQRLGSGQLDRIIENHQYRLRTERD